jgi:sister-chromatid-cohesion protein PDS5
MVRHNLLRKLGEVLPAQRLLPRWNIMPAMLATDPEPENPLMVSTSIIYLCVRR